MIHAHSCAATVDRQGAPSFDQYLFVLCIRTFLHSPYSGAVFLFSHLDRDVRGLLVVTALLIDIALRALVSECILVPPCRTSNLETVEQCLAIRSGASLNLSQLQNGTVEMLQASVG